MNKFILILLLAINICGGLSAQEILVQSFNKLDLDLLNSSQSRLDLNGNPCAVIRINPVAKNLYFEGNIIGTPELQSKDVFIYIAQNSPRLIIKSEKYGVLRYEFHKPIESGMVYDLSLKYVENKVDKIRTVIIPMIGFSKYDQTSYGLMLGVVKKIGGYAKIESNLSGTSQFHDEVESDDYAYSYNFGESQNHLAITAGALFRLSRPLYIYLGAGYMHDYVGWPIWNSEYVKIKDFSVEGVAAEIGGIFRLGIFAVSAGVLTNSFKRVESNFGIGVMF